MCFTQKKYCHAAPLFFSTRIVVHFTNVFNTISTLFKKKSSPASSTHCCVIHFPHECQLQNKTYRICFICVNKKGYNITCRKKKKLKILPMTMTDLLNALMLKLAVNQKILWHVKIYLLQVCWCPSTVDLPSRNRMIEVNIGRPLSAEHYVPIEGWFWKHTKDAWQIFIASDAFVRKPLADQKPSDKVVVFWSCFGRSWNYVLNTPL